VGATHWLKLRAAARKGADAEKGSSLIDIPIAQDIGVRPTQLTKSKQHYRSLGRVSICYKIFMDVEICEMCRPDTYEGMLRKTGDKISRKMSYIKG
jgi:hypothetical protein